MKLVKEHINFERGQDPLDTMKLGNVEERKLKSYYDVIAASKMFVMEKFKFPAFYFTSINKIGPNTPFCTNEKHFGEIASFTVGYDDGSDYEKGFYFIFDNNGYTDAINSLSEVKKYFGIDQIKESINFERGQDPMKSMDIGKHSKRQLVLDFLINVSKDFQLDKNDPNYMGFLNVYKDSFMNQNIKDGFIEFVNTWPKYKNDLYSIGLDIEENIPSLEETVFVNKD